MEPVRIDVNKLKWKLDHGEPVLIIDTRSPASWEGSNHQIPGAVRLHYHELEEHLDELPRDRTIVTYCT